MSFERLLTLMPPPPQPVEIPSPQQWQDVQSRLGPLPRDYLDFINCYGSGEIDDFLWIFNPASVNIYSNLEFQVKAALGTLREVYQNEPEEEVALFPEPGGLLPFGGTANGDTLFWKTTGTPETWTVCRLAARDPGRVDLSLNFTGALAAVLAGSSATGDFLPADFPSERPAFVPPGFADFSAQLQTGLFVAGSLPFSRRLEQHLQAQPWQWLSWYWMPPHPDWSAIAREAFFDLSQSKDPAAVTAFLTESGFAACGAVAILYTPELPALLLAPDLLLSNLAAIFQGYGGVRFIFGCMDLSPDPEIIPGVIAQFDHTSRLRFVRQ